MQQKTFDEGIKRLMVFFTYKLDKERAKGYWDKIKHFDDEPFSKAVENLIETKERFPSFAELMNALFPFQKEEMERKEQERRKAEEKAAEDFRTGRIAGSDKAVKAVCEALQKACTGEFTLRQYLDVFGSHYPIEAGRLLDWYKKRGTDINKTAYFSMINQRPEEEVLS